MKKRRHNQFDNDVKQPTVRFVIKYGEPKHHISIELIKNEFINQLVNQLKDNVEYIHYYQSVATGEKYGGYYDYIPASDPICEEVYEGRIDIFDKLYSRINELEENCERLNKINKTLTSSIR